MTPVLPGSKRHLAVDTKSRDQRPQNGKTNNAIFKKSRCHQLRLAI
jgi:hypothetical protein